MIIFLGIFGTLLFINGILLVFSVNGAKESLMKPVNRFTETKVTKLLPSENSSAKLKKAV